MQNHFLLQEHRLMDIYDHYRFFINPIHVPPKALMIQVFFL